MQLPAVLKPFQKIGEKLFNEGKVKQIEFSGGTYQVQVSDDKQHQDVWSFLQLDNRNRLKDSFCSCDESEDVAACPHLAASFLYIFNNSKLPLHQRFEKSLWNKLCYLYGDRLKFKADLFNPSSKGIYAIYSVGGKQIFLVQGKTKPAMAHLKDLLFNRQPETEETSLKFSNLPQEEIILWKEGRPSAHLSYELSFWSDLAKWLMSLQDEGKKYRIEFEYSPQDIPNYISIDFDDLYCKFYLSEANLPIIIPALTTVKAPLPVHNVSSQDITKITYDKEKGCFLVDSKESAKKAKSLQEMPKGTRFGSWLYVPKKGFYPLDPLGLLSSKTINSDQVSRVLNENFPFVKDHLEGAVLHEDPIKVSYTLDFDDAWNLHINSYIFTPGDLNLPGSRFFGEWAYLEDDGFYKLENLLFKQVETVIKSDEVGDFIQQNRTWLNQHEGFETHLASVEAQLTYKMDSEMGPLSFQRTVTSASKENGKAKDFGPWVYIAGQGFYAKVTTHIGLPLRPGIALNAEQIPMFIRVNREELKMVPHFFSEKCPVIHAGLDISIDANGQIFVSPQYDLLPEYNHKMIGFFDEFTYVQGEGFAELPAECRLPVDYRTPVNIDPNNQALFLNFMLKNLRPLVTHLDPRLESPKQLSLVAHNIARADLDSKGWYTIKLGYQSDLGETTVSDLWGILKKKQRFCFSEAGLIDLEDKRFDWLRLLAKKRLDRRSNTLTLSTIELIRLNAFDPIETLKDNESDYQHSIELLKELTEFQIPDEPDLQGLKSDLRPYQQIGLHWLWFLYHHGLSGLLCDDMGLGKTHQTMALLAAVTNYHKKRGEGVNRHFLIVCPTSVIYHWQDKLAEFLPELRVCTFYGSNRSIKEFREQYDILLTSYGVWRNEHELLSHIPFEVGVFDEIQIAKNHNSRIHAALSHVNSQMRLGLTGTPIENHLRELKSLFDLVLPTYMPGEKDFREYFVKPIEKDRDPERKTLLSRLIHPFVMRRKKEDVLTDLPEKIEEISHCGLSDEQARMYNQVVERSRKVVLEELAQKDEPIPYIHVFAILSYLKQICDHPACYLKEPEKSKEFQSGKWDLFVELLNEARESRQKVVVFSQYLNMLDIIQNHLNEAGIGYASIRGSTTDRGDQLKRFNEDPNCEVFVGSLQASGLGVELTAASVVIHYDRWWNAARENQATDRVHRIGQTRGVQVFKLVTKGTFEEKIDAMIARKGQLMEDVVGVDDHRLLKHFTRDEIIELLQNATPTGSVKMEGVS
jgi:superfamily II DNA or RNA helicase